MYCAGWLAGSTVYTTFLFPQHHHRTRHPRQQLELPWAGGKGQFQVAIQLQNLWRTEHAMSGLVRWDHRSSILDISVSQPRSSTRNTTKTTITTQTTEHLGKGGRASKISSYKKCRGESLQSPGGGGDTFFDLVIPCRFQYHVRLGLVDNLSNLFNCRYDPRPTDRTTTGIYITQVNPSTLVGWAGCSGQHSHIIRLDIQLQKLWRREHAISGLVVGPQLSFNVLYVAFTSSISHLHRSLGHHIQPRLARTVEQAVAYHQWAIILPDIGGREGDWSAVNCPPARLWGIRRSTRHNVGGRSVVSTVIGRVGGKQARSNSTRLWRVRPVSTHALEGGWENRSAAITRMSGRAGGHHGSAGAAKSDSVASTWRRLETYLFMRSRRAHARPGRLAIVGGRAAQRSRRADNTRLWRAGGQTKRSVSSHIQSGSTTRIARALEGGWDTMVGGGEVGFCSLHVAPPGNYLNPPWLSRPVQKRKNPRHRQDRQPSTQTVGRLAQTLGGWVGNFRPRACNKVRSVSTHPWGPPRGAAWKLSQPSGLSRPVQKRKIHRREVGGNLQAKSIGQDSRLSPTLGGGKGIEVESTLLPDSTGHHTSWRAGGKRSIVSTHTAKTVRRLAHAWEGGWEIRSVSTHHANKGRIEAVEAGNQTGRVVAGTAFLLSPFPTVPRYIDLTDSSISVQPNNFLRRRYELSLNLGDRYAHIRPKRPSKYTRRLLEGGRELSLQTVQPIGLIS
ncbi:hypothetical protein V8F20_008915 [Naviculisporaceae sp. PSN 640]